MAARNELRAGVNEAGCTVRLCQEQGRQLYVEQKYDEALASLEHVADSLRRSPSFHLDRGLIYYALGRFEPALADFDFVLKEFDSSFRAAAQRAHTLIRLGRFDAAKAQLENLIGTPAAKGEFRGLKSESYLKGNLGVVEILRGQAAAGRTLLDEAFRLDGSNTLASTYRFYVLPQLEAGKIDRDGVFALLVASEDVGLGRIEQAEKQLSVVLEKFPSFPESYFLQAEILRAKHRFDECERVLRIGEKHLPALVDLTAERLRCALLKVGPTSAAAKAPLVELRELRAKHPDNTRVFEILHALDLS